MSEISGCLVFHLPEAFKATLRGPIAFSDMQAIFTQAKAGDLLALSRELIMWQGENLAGGCEWHKQDDKHWCIIYPDDSVWETITQHLVAHGIGIELYGYIAGEDGWNTLIALGEGERFFAPTDDYHKVSQWQALLPKNLKNIAADLWEDFEGQD